MNILYIAPLPPPITGHSLASFYLLEELQQSNKVTFVNLSKNSFKNGAFEISRFFQIFLIFYQIIKFRKEADVVYFSISQSLAGNIKDLIIYCILYKKLPVTYIHLHGGSIGRDLFSKYKHIFNLNKFFVKKLAGVIVLGQSHCKIFDSFVDSERLFVVKNFCENEYFFSESLIFKKFENLDFEKLKILFLSNMQIEKGYNQIIDAFKLLEIKHQNKLELHFAGKFDNSLDENTFLNEIIGFNNIYYHGVVQGVDKLNLLKSCHVFCLPTTFMEGQPLSIIESYAAGLVVLTTLNGGIVDIFADKINGYEILSDSKFISKIFIEILNSHEKLLEISLFNREFALNNFKSSLNLYLLKSIILK